MLQLHLPEKTGPLEVLCIGAHSDDIEIGCAGTLLSLVERGHTLRVTWVVLSAAGERAEEARQSAYNLLGRVVELHLRLGVFRDAHFPAQFSDLKNYIADLGGQVDPDVIFTHSLDDRHQDHRLVAELTWQSWRDHFILEYEIPKYDGDLGQPNVFFPIASTVRARKRQHLLTHFGTQRSKSWFTGETFDSLMRVRGIECKSKSGYAEAFRSRKILI